MWYKLKGGKMPKEFWLGNLNDRHYLVQFDINLRTVLISVWVTPWRIWLRHCATNRKVAGSILKGVIGISH
jgi:hypothetical protein